MSGGDWKEMLVAVQNGNLELVKYHIEHGIDPNYQHPELMTTPLIESIECQQLEIAAYLLENGSDPTLRAWLSEDSPLRMAKKSKNKEMIRLVKSYLPDRSWFSFPWR